MPNFTYNQNIPDAPNNPSDDQPLMQVNTNSTYGILNVDMIGFGNNNGGYHSKITFPDATSPVPTPSGPMGVLYSVLDSSSASQLVFVNKNGTYPVTGGTASGNGWSYLAGGVILAWGSTSFPSQGSSFSFPIPFGSSMTNGFPTSCFVLKFTTHDQGNTACAVSPNTITRSGAASVYWLGSNPSINTFWLAVGN